MGASAPENNFIRPVLIDNQVVFADMEFSKSNPIDVQGMITEDFRQ